MPAITRRGVLTTAAVALALGGLALGGATRAFAQDGKPEQVTIVSGPAGSGWNATGGGLAALLARQGIRANSEPGGAFTNIIQISRKQAEIGFTMGVATGMAPAGERPFPGPITNVRGLALFGDQVGHFMVRADAGVNSFADLRGKPFASQPPGNASQIAFADVMKAIGMSESDVRVSRGTQEFGGDGVRDRRFVGVTAMTGVPGPMFADVANTVNVRFLGLSEEVLARVLALNAGWVRRVIPANSYRGQTQDVLTFGTPALMIVHQDMSDQTAYWLTRHMHTNLRDFQRVTAALEFMTPERMPQTTGVTLHPGAARYYREIGVLR